jgi:alkylhydroperoxidase family enzyme
MNRRNLLTMSILAAALQFAPMAFGQDESQQGWNRRGRWENQASNLTPEERQKLQATRQKAMQDPAVHAAREKMRQAQKEFQESMRAAMLKADPSVQAILDKIPKSGRANPEED